MLTFKFFIIAYFYKEDFDILNFSNLVNSISISIVFILHSNSYIYLIKWYPQLFVCLWGRGLSLGLFR